MPDQPATEPKSVPDVIGELWELVKDYAQQETVDPLKGLTRFLGFGVAGAVTLGIGTILLALAGLRALQTETGTTFTGNWSWAPYFITLIGTAIVIALAVSRVGKSSGAKR